MKLNYKWKELKPKKLSQTDNKEMKPFRIKVQLFWEGHKNLGHPPYGFDIYLKNIKTIRRILKSRNAGIPVFGFSRLNGQWRWGWICWMLCILQLWRRWKRKWTRHFNNSTPILLNQVCCSIPIRSRSKLIKPSKHLKQATMKSQYMDRASVYLFRLIHGW